MDGALAHQRLTEVLDLIERWGGLYERRWGYRHPFAQKNPQLEQQVEALIDEVRTRTRLARDLIAAMGEKDLAAKVVEHEEGQFGGHPFTQAHLAIVEAVAILAQREELAEIVGPVGPRLSASEFTQLFGARPPHCGTTAISPKRFKPLPPLSKACFRAKPMSTFRVRASVTSFNERPDARIATSSAWWCGRTLVEDVEISA